MVKSTSLFTPEQYEGQDREKHNPPPLPNHPCLLGMKGHHHLAMMIVMMLTMLWWQHTHLQGTTKQGFPLELPHAYTEQGSQDKKVCSLVPLPSRHSCHGYTCKGVQVKDNKGWRRWRRWFTSTPWQSPKQPPLRRRLLSAFLLPGSPQFDPQVPSPPSGSQLLEPQDFPCKSNVIEKLIFMVYVPANGIWRELHIGKSPHIGKGNLLLIENHPVCNASSKHLHTASRLWENFESGKKGILAGANEYNFWLLCWQVLSEKMGHISFCHLILLHLHLHPTPQLHLVRQCNWGVIFDDSFHFSTLMTAHFSLSFDEYEDKDDNKFTSWWLLNSSSHFLMNRRIMIAINSPPSFSPAKAKALSLIRPTIPPGIVISWSIYN